MTVRHHVVGQLFDIGVDILVTSLHSVTKVILAQIGDSTNAVPDADAAEWWQHTGFVSRPAVPTAGSASCQGIVLKNGDRDAIIATRDTRGTKIYGELKDGATCIYASTGQARTFYNPDGAIVDYTTQDNTATGTSLSQYLGPDGYVLSTPWGGITINSSGVTITAGQAALILASTGDAKIVGQTASVHGGIAALLGEVLTTVGPVTPAQAATNRALYGPQSIAPEPGIASKTVIIAS